MLRALDLAIERLVGKVINDHPSTSHKEGSKNKDKKKLGLWPTLRSEKEGPKRWKKEKKSSRLIEQANEIGKCDRRSHETYLSKTGECGRRYKVSPDSLQPH
jgi:hypothetical protein